MEEVPTLLAAVLAAWILIGWISGTILTIWDYNNGEPIALSDIFTLVLVGAFGGLIVFFFMMNQFPEEFKKTNLGKYLNKPIWQKKPEEK
jgi:hypothetical protein